MPLLSTASLIGIALWLQVNVRVRAELAFLTASCAVILVLYLAALGGWLAAAATMIYAVGLVLGTVAITRVVTSAPRNRAAILVSTFTFVALAAVAWNRLENGAYSTWDEFSHWGRMGKALSVSHALPTATTGVLFKDYPPGAGLFQYFVVNSSFSEGATYFAQALLLIAVVVSLLRWTGRAAALHYVLGLAAGLGVMEILGMGYTTVEVDHLVGALFGACLGGYAVNDRSDLRSTLALVPALFCLPLMKPIAIVMAFSAAVVIVLDLVRMGYRERRAETASDWRRSFAPRVAVCVLVIVAPVAAHQSWGAWVRAQNFNITFQVPLTVERLRTVVTPAARTPRQQAVVTNFGRAVERATVGRYGNGIIDGAGVWTGPRTRLGPRSVPDWFVCLSALSVLVFLLIPHEKRITHAVVQSALCLGSIGYLALLLYAYLFGFGEYEALRVISFGRYASPWFLAWALAIIAAFGLASLGKPLQYGVSVIVLILSNAWVVWQDAPRSDRKAVGAAITAATERRVVQVISRPIEGAIPPSAATHVIWQNSTGFPFYLMSYELSPRWTNASCWSLGQKYNEGDIWTCPWSPQQFSVWLEAYDYLVIGYADDQFWETYQSLFEGGASAENRSGRLFERVKTGTPPILRLVAVPPKH